MNIDKSKLLVLWSDDFDFYQEKMKERGVNVFSIFKKEMNKFSKLIWKVFIKLKIPYLSFWFGEWKSKLSKLDVIILLDLPTSPIVVKYVKKINPNIRIIIWYWNSVYKSLPVETFSKDNCEIWSFDKSDCNEYNLNFNNQFYFNNVVLDVIETKYDVFFVGSDKGRMEYLIKIKKKLNLLGISSYFHITSIGKSDNKYTQYYSKPIPYEMVLEKIKGSKVILDIVSTNQNGLTIRPLEAMFYQKKLITNFEDIENYDFYKEQNIFILGKDNIEELSDFIDAPYEGIDSRITDKYDFDIWLNNFYIE